MSDQCKSCSIKGNYQKCLDTECFHHENWIAKQHIVEIFDMYSRNFDYKKCYYGWFWELIGRCWHCGSRNTQDWNDDHTNCNIYIPASYEKTQDLLILKNHGIMGKSGMVFFDEFAFRE